MIDNDFSFNELIYMVRRKHKSTEEYTEYCIEQDCFANVLRYGMFCNEHKKETE